jgi:hypothetical protein
MQSPFLKDDSTAIQIPAEHIKDPIVLFSSRAESKSKYKLKGKPISIVATNIPSFMGSRLNIWHDARNKIGI